MSSSETLELPPTKWGPKVWYTLHLFAAGYPDEPNEVDKYNMKQFVMFFAELLPCPQCRNEFKKLLIEIPVDSYLDSNETMEDWIHNVHNRVNKRLGKDHQPNKRHWAKMQCYHQTIKKTNDQTTMYIGVFIVALAIVIGGYYIAKIKK